MKKSITISIVILLIIVLAIIYLNKEKDITIPFKIEDKYYGKSEYIKVNNKNINKMKKESYILFTYNDYCTFPIPCEEIFKKYMDKENISIVSIPFIEYKKTICKKMSEGA